MPIVKEAKYRTKLRVEVHTRKCSGALIRCNPCGYTGSADVVEMKSRRNGRRSMERCPECKSLNIVCVEKSIMDEEQKAWEVDEWEGCYPSQWKGVIIPEAMAHPAKFSSRLIRRIYEHLFEEGWVQQGDRIVDPFGGVALGALHAMEMGLHWTGCELEPKFVELGSGYDCPGFSKADWVRFYGRARRVNGSHNLHWCPECLVRMDSYVNLYPVDLFSSNGHGQIPSQEPHRFHGNIDLWNSTYGNQPHWGTASLLQGDSRNLAALVGGKQNGSISSPPFEQRSADGGWQMLGKYAEEGKLTVKQVKGNTNKSYPSWDKERDTSYGDSVGQMANMKTSEESFKAAVTSPPFRHSEGGTPEPKPGGVIDERLYARHAAGNSAADGYGVTEGQLANMKEGNYQGAVSSPPWEDKLSADRVNPDERRDLARAKGISNAEYVTPIDMEAIGGREQKDARYGFTDGQLGADSGDDFWLAARQIVEQVYLLLEPGGHAAWVVKDFVRNKERVAFSDQWRQLCEAVGFVTLHEHHALLVHHKGTSLTLEGEVVEHKTESKSFFRRIAEKRGSPRVDWEVVYCMVKPGI